MIDTMDAAFQDWADKMRGGVRGPLGYAKCNWYRLAGGGGDIRQVPHDQNLRQADKVEALVTLWATTPGLAHLAVTVREYYVVGGRFKSTVAQRLGINRKTLSDRLQTAQEKLENHLKSGDTPFIVRNSYGASSSV